MPASGQNVKNSVQGNAFRVTLRADISLQATGLKGENPEVAALSIGFRRGQGGVDHQDDGRHRAHVGGVPCVACHVCDAELF